MDLEEILKDGLNIPVIQPFHPIITPCFTWQMQMSSAGLAGNGRATENTDLYQVDIWSISRKEAISITERAGSLIQSKCETTIPTISYGYDTNGKVWRGTINFYHIKEES